MTYAIPNLLSAKYSLWLLPGPISAASNTKLAISIVLTHFRICRAPGNELALLNSRPNPRFGSVAVPATIQNATCFGAGTAAKRRKNRAHGASREWITYAKHAPQGAIGAAFAIRR
jgi:hypothetical protein